jgi:hypothetical protein
MPRKQHSSTSAPQMPSRDGSGGRRGPLLFAERMERRRTTTVPSARRRQPPVRPRPPRPRAHSGQRFLVVATLLVLLVGAGYFVLGSGTFAVRQVTLRGMTNGSVVAAVAQQQLPGQNLLFLHTSAIAARLAALPVVAHVTVARVWPRSVIITVTLRRPVVAWQTPAGIFLIDATGMVIGRVAQGNKPAGAGGQSGTTGSARNAPNGAGGQKAAAYPSIDGVPIISDARGKDIAGQALAPGGHLDPALIGMAVQLAQRLPTETQVTGFSMKYLGQDGGMVVKAVGWQARFGGPEHLGLKIGELRAILQLMQAQGQSNALIDLRYGAHPYYRLLG